MKPLIWGLVKLLDTKNKMKVAKGQGEGEKGSCLMDTGFQIYKIKQFQKYAAQ